jgi:hypothetical protein
MILEDLSKRNNPEILKKAVYIFLDYIKTEYFIKNQNLSESTLMKIRNDILIQKYIIDYIYSIIKIISSNNIEPFKEIAYILYLM